MTRKLALDPGFGEFKVAEANGQTTLTNLIPSVIGLGSLGDMGLLSVGMRRSHKGQDKPIEVEINEQSYLVGRNVHEYAEPVERLDYQRLSEGPELRALVYVALASRMKGGPYNASLLVGLPVEVMQNRSQAQRALAALRGWLVGRHQFKMAGDEYDITVEKVKVMAQPLGSYFAFGLNGAGKWDDSRVDWEAPAAVVDIGFNTVDMFGIKGGRLISRFTGGDRLGMHKAARSIVSQVDRMYKVKMSLYEADQMIRRYVAGSEVTLYHPKGVADLRELIRTALSKTFSAVNEFIDDHLGRAGFRYLLNTGGGAEALKPWLVEQYPTATILPEPVTANAVGLAEFAIRDGIL